MGFAEALDPLETIDGTKLHEFSCAPSDLGVSMRNYNARPHFEKKSKTVKDGADWSGSKDMTMDGEGPLGLGLNMHDGQCLVNQITPTGLANGLKSEGLCEGLLLTSVAGQDVTSSKLHEIQAYIVNGTRPLVLGFAIPSDGQIDRHEAAATTKVTDFPIFVMGVDNGSIGYDGPSPPQNRPNRP